ncbi:MAG: carbohydrate binding domain-containing protein [Candidatus Symbiothrix sp.]|jgi:hypothetical protein|nr:carbohydrate binding domain-containing protein [Candidatus Symbiothrix sp.]
MRKNLSRFAVLLLLLNFVLMTVSAQIPYVYNVENTGASYPAPPLPTLADCPVIVPLPDPFAWANDPLGSTRSTAFSDWSHHRAEIKAQIEHYEIGLKPAVDLSQISASFSADSTLTVIVTVGEKTLTLTSKITLPAGDAPFPVVIGMNGNSLPAAAFTIRNIARMTFSANQVTTYGSPQNTDPYYQLYPDQNIDNSGQYVAWSWGVSRLIDGLYLTQATNKIDVAHIAVTGCSYAGKMALFAGAFDERVALTIPQESGGGGVASWRFSYTQSGVEGLSQTDHNWFRESMFSDFGGDNVSKLPDDHHMLCAMVAPRALYVTGNTDYLWLSNPSCYVSSRAVQQIYNTLGIGDRFGFCVNGGHGHCAFPASQDAELAYFLDKYMLGNTGLSQTIETRPDAYIDVDYERWTHWWGSGDPVLPPEIVRTIEGIWLEAECGTVGSGWTFKTDETASKGQYIVYEDPNFLPSNPNAADAITEKERAVYTFTVDEAGNYKVFGRLNCPTADDDSFYTRLDSRNYETVNNIATSGWQWVQLSAAALTAGEHSFTIAYRENGAMLDKLVVTDSELPPSGSSIGGDAINCIPPPLVYDRENTGADCTIPALPAPADLPSVVRLPNPFEFEFSNGQRVVNTIADWECRRNEIKAEIEQYEIGVKPPRPADITAAYAESVLTITVVENGQTLTLTPRVTIPATGTGPFPVVIGISSGTGSLPTTLFANCIQVNYNPGQVASDGQARTGAFYTMYPDHPGGHYAAWSWGVSRIIDGLELRQADLNVDLAHIGITGCSRYGKLALFGGAFDERIALTIAQEPGGGGAAAWRVSESLGNVEKIDNTDESWFMPSMRTNFAGKVDRLLHDHHELIAMIAPRAVLILGNDGIEWLADPSGYVSAMAAREVWKRFGAEDRIGFDFSGGHNHCSAPASQIDASEKFIQRFLYGDNTVDTEILTSSYQNVNYQFWISDWANVTGANVALQQLWREAESETCAAVDAELTVLADENASDGKYVTNQSAESAIYYTSTSFIVSELDGFDVYFRVNSSEASAAFTLQIDGNEPVACDIPNTNNAWRWVKVLSPDLFVGAHAIKVGVKTGAKLDRIYITNDAALIPTALGDLETNCDPPIKYTIFDFENGHINDWTKQNGAAGITVTQEDKHGGEYALKLANGSGTNAWSIQPFTPAVDIVPDHIYTVSFWARAVGGEGKGRISTTDAGKLGEQYWPDKIITDTWEQYFYTNLVAKGTSVRLALDFGYIANKTYYIDDIVFDDTNVRETDIIQLPGATGAWTGKIYSSEKGSINIIAPENSVVQVTDVLGRTLGARKIANSTLQFSVSSAGIYIVSVKSGNSMHTQKVIVK